MNGEIEERGPGRLESVRFFSLPVRDSGQDVLGVASFQGLELQKEERSSRLGGPHNLRAFPLLVMASQSLILFTS